MTPIERVRAVLAAGTPGPLTLKRTDDFAPPAGDPTRTHVSIRSDRADETLCGEWDYPRALHDKGYANEWLADATKLTLAANLAPAFLALWEAASVIEPPYLARPNRMYEALAALNEAAAREVGEWLG